MRPTASSTELRVNDDAHGRRADERDHTAARRDASADNRLQVSSDRSLQLRRRLLAAESDLEQIRQLLNPDLPDREQAQVDLAVAQSLVVRLAREFQAMRAELEYFRQAWTAPATDNAVVSQTYVLPSPLEIALLPVWSLILSYLWWG